MSPESLFALDSYTLKRGGFSLWWRVLAGDELVASAWQKAFKLKEDLRLYRGDGGTREELLAIHARAVIDIGATYDLLDAREQVVLGAARHHGLRSFWRTRWDVLDPDGDVVASCRGLHGWRYLFRRTFRITPHGTVPSRDPEPATPEEVEIRMEFAWFQARYGVHVGPECPLDRRLLMAVSLLVAVIATAQASSSSS